MDEREKIKIEQTIESLKQAWIEAIETQDATNETITLCKVMHAATGTSDPYYIDDTTLKTRLDAYKERCKYLGTFNKKGT